MEVKELNDEEIIKEVEIVDSFLKYVDDEIKKTDIGEQDEKQD